MSKVVSFTEYTPSPRYDATAWTQARIEESPSKDGPWTLLETKNLDPVDADPTNPATRSFTTELAVLDDGWYRIVFKDATGDYALPTTPIHDSIDLNIPYKPTVAQVASLIRARTKDSNGTEQGTFTALTRPTFNMVENLIDQAAEDVTTVTDKDIPLAAYTYVKRAIAVRTAMEIELGYFPETVGTSNSSYDRLKDMYEEMIGKVLIAVERETLEELTGEQGEVSGPIYSFPTVPIDFGTVKW